MKKFLVLAMVAGMCLLPSCTKSTTEVSSDFNIPSELEGLKIYRMEGGTKILYIAVLPQEKGKVVSTTDASKSGTTVLTPQRISIDGKNYILTEEQEDK
jgi:hypothetical protein